MKKQLPQEDRLLQRITVDPKIFGGNWSTDPGDQEILDRARQEVRLLATLDKDFG